MNRSVPFLAALAVALPTSAFALSANPTGVAVYVNVPTYMQCQALWQSNHDTNRVQNLGNIPAEDGNAIELTCTYNTGQMAFRVQAQADAYSPPAPWQSPISIIDAQTGTTYKWATTPAANQTSFGSPVTLDGSPSGDGTFLHVYYWGAPVTGTQPPGQYVLGAVFTVTSI